MKKICLAGGCFWGVEAYLSRIEGVKETKVGYANGHLPNPSYQQVCEGTSGHAEACLVTYDETVLSLEKLLERFWHVIDPTLINRQGPDVGHQYRTGIYYLSPEDLPIIEKTKEKEQAKYSYPIVTEILPLTCFYEAEEYHQKYLEKNPRGYCHIPLD